VWQPSGHPGIFSAIHVEVQLVFESTTPAARPHSRFLCVSAFAHATAILLLVTIHFSSSIRAIAAQTGHATLLAPYLPKHADMPRHRAHPPVPAPIAPPEPVPEPRHIAHEFHAPAPLRATPAPVKIELAAIPAPEIPRVTIPTVVIPTVESPRIERVTTAVKTGTFAATSTTIATPAVFAKPVGLAGLDAADRPTNSTRPARAVSSVGGFSDSAAASASRTSNATISRGGFGDVTIAANATAARKSDAPAASSPVEILSKPHPAYTAEARSLRLEGEVLLEIRFAASGDAHCMRVVRGLGHGLDETAIAAAREIRFRPARQNGAAIDSDAIVHIQFQLAY
jgi:periplasmic protein TonB